MGRLRTKDKHLPRRVYLEYGAYYFRPKAGGRVPLGREYAAAMLAWASLQKENTSISDMNSVFDRYQSGVLPLKGDRTCLDQTKELKLLREAFGHLLPEQVTSPQIYAYMDARGAPTRANHEKALLSHVFTKCIEWGLVKLNPCVGVKKLFVEKHDHVPEPDDIEWFRRWAGPMLNAYIDVKLATGLRQGDMLTIEVSQITSDELVVSINKSKRTDSRTGKASKGKVRRFRLTAELRDLIRTARTLPGKGLAHTLFANNERQPYTSSGFRAIWQTHMRKAVAKAKEEGVEFTRFREHDLRARVATDAGSEAQKLLAHDDPRTTAGYIRGRDAETVTPLPVKRNIPDAA